MGLFFVVFVIFLIAISAHANSIDTKPARRLHNPNLFNLLSGGFAGTISSTITSPLEVIKTQLQSSSTGIGAMSKVQGSPLGVAKEIYKADGITGFWRGLPPTLVGIIPARSVYFYSYDLTKNTLKPKIGLGSLNAAISGIMAGFTSNTVTNPIWMVKTRMQLLSDTTVGQKAYTSYPDAIKTIYREEGLGGFYRGITASYWGCAEGCVQFVLYEKLKGKLIDRENNRRKAEGKKAVSKLPPLTLFCTAAVSKCVATVSTYPHEVARTRMREQARSGVFKYNGMWQTIGTVFKEEGRKGIYAGMGTHVARVVPNSALMFMSYEIVQNWIRTENKKTLAMREEEGKQGERHGGRTNGRTCFTR
ncbi:hypothetical protein TrRE_jg5588 [Triparma retinervis]|uniref:Mitochondrial carrier n=1 Tax=Triparma retinervis TaxID=2557542 RepID=A0A9W7FC98_9STRA|nr:hypothetical protein TrRE_jg5588 [Triparma retinervis]